MRCNDGATYLQVHHEYVASSARGEVDAPVWDIALHRLSIQSQTQSAILVYGYADR